MDNRGIEKVEMVIKLTDGTEFTIRTTPYDPALNGHDLIIEDSQHHGEPNVDREGCLNLAELFATLSEFFAQEAQIPSEVVDLIHVRKSKRRT